MPLKYFWGHLAKIFGHFKSINHCGSISEQSRKRGTASGVQCTRGELLTCIWMNWTWMAQVVHVDGMSPEQECGRIYAPGSMDISVIIYGKFIDPLPCFTQAEMHVCLWYLFHPTQICSNMNLFSPRNAQTWTLASATQSSLELTARWEFSSLTSLSSSSLINNNRFILISIIIIL